MQQHLDRRPLPSLRFAPRRRDGRLELCFARVRIGVERRVGQRFELRAIHHDEAVGRHRGQRRAAGLHEQPVADLARSVPAAGQHDRRIGAVEARQLRRSRRVRCRSRRTRARRRLERIASRLNLPQLLGRTRFEISLDHGRADLARADLIRASAERILGIRAGRRHRRIRIRRGATGIGGPRRRTRLPRRCRVHSAGTSPSLQVGSNGIRSSVLCSVPAVTASPAARIFVTYSATTLDLLRTGIHSTA